MFKRSISPNLKGKIRQHYRCQLNNGIYEGDMLHYKKDGVGVFLNDEGSAYIGHFYLDTFHGEGILLFKRGGIYYGQFEKGKAQGFCIIRWKGIYICGNFHQGQINGYLYCYNEKTKVWKMSEYLEGRKIKDIKEESTSSSTKIPMFLQRDSFLSSKYLSFLDLKIESIFKKNVEESLTLLESDQNPRERYIGFIGRAGILKGLGLIINEDILQMSGSYEEGKIQGLGSIFHKNGDIYEGFFRKDEMEGQGIYYTKIHDSYVHAIFKRNECIKVLSSGQGFPLELCHKMKQRAHQKSVEYMNSNMSLKSTGVNISLIFKSIEGDLTATQKLKELSPFIDRSIGQYNQSRLINQPFIPMSPEKQLLLTSREDQRYRISPSMHQQAQQKENHQNSPDLNKYEHYLNSSYHKGINSSHFLNRSQLSAKRRDIFEASPKSGRSNLISPSRSAVDLFQIPPIEKSLSQLASFSPSQSFSVLPITQKSAQSFPQAYLKFEESVTNHKFKPIFGVQKSNPSLNSKTVSSIQDTSIHYHQNRQDSSPSLRNYQFKGPYKNSSNSPTKFPQTVNPFSEFTHYPFMKSISPSLKNDFKEQKQKSPFILTQTQFKKTETPKMSLSIPVVTNYKGLQDTEQTQLNQKLKKMIGEQKQYSPSFQSSSFKMIEEPSTAVAGERYQDQKFLKNHSFKNQFDFNQAPSNLQGSQTTLTSDRLFPNLSINSQLLSNAPFIQIFEQASSSKVTK